MLVCMDIRARARYDIPSSGTFFQYYSIKKLGFVDNAFAEKPCVNIFGKVFVFHVPRLNGVYFQRGSLCAKLLHSRSNIFRWCWM